MPLPGYPPLPDSRVERVAIYEADPVEYCRRMSGADLNRLLRAVGKMRGVSDRQGEVWFYENWREKRREMVRTSLGRCTVHRSPVFDRLMRFCELAYIDRLEVGGLTNARDCVVVADELRGDVDADEQGA